MIFGFNDGNVEIVFLSYSCYFQVDIVFIDNNEMCVGCKFILDFVYIFNGLQIMYIFEVDFGDWQFVYVCFCCDQQFVVIDVCVV